MAFYPSFSALALHQKTKNYCNKLFIFDDQQPVGEEHQLWRKGLVNKHGGKNIYLNETAVSDFISGKDQTVIPHEAGHSLGLYHPDQPAGGLDGLDQLFSGQRFSAGSDKSNLMFSGGIQRDLSKVGTLKKSQIRRIVKNIRTGKVNKGK